MVSLSILTPPFLAGLKPEPSSMINFLNSSTKTLGWRSRDTVSGIRSGAMATHRSRISVVWDAMACAVQSLSVLKPPRMTSPLARGIVSAIPSSLSGIQRSLRRPKAYMSSLPSWSCELLRAYTRELVPAAPGPEWGNNSDPQLPPDVWPQDRHR